jgi:hypothetical protein
VHERVLFYGHGMQKTGDNKMQDDKRVKKKRRVTRLPSPRVTELHGEYRGVAVPLVVCTPAALLPYFVRGQTVEDCMSVEFVPGPSESCRAKTRQREY